MPLYSVSQICHDSACHLNGSFSFYELNTLVGKKGEM